MYLQLLSLTKYLAMFVLFLPGVLTVELTVTDWCINSLSSLYTSTALHQNLLMGG
jgi:hypothetical protein